MYMILLLIPIVLYLFKLQYPTFSFLEIHNSPAIFLQTISPHWWWLIRLVSIFIAFGLGFVVTKKYRLSLFSQIVLLTTPWLFLLAREYNIYINVLFLIFIMYMTNVKKRFVYILSLILIGLLVVTSVPSISTIQDKLILLRNYFSVPRMFFQMEGESFYFYILKVGYFSVFTLPLLFLGVTQYKKMTFFILPTILSMLFFLLYPTTHFIFAGAGFLTIILFIILIGANQVRNKYVKVCLSLFLILNFAFFLEIYFRHYHIKYGNERGYAEYMLIEKVIKKPNAQVFLPENNSLRKLEELYRPHYTLPKISYFSEAPLLLDKNCRNENIICVLTEEQMILLKHDIQKSYDVITEPGGLKIYYLL